MLYNMNSNNAEKEVNQIRFCVNLNCDWQLYKIMQKKQQKNKLANDA